MGGRRLGLPPAWMRDPYEILGLPHDAGPDDIKQAYRLLARQLHPDSDRQNPRAEERFKELSAAYKLLSDVDSRAGYDRGEIDASGVRNRKVRSERAAQSGGGGRIQSFKNFFRARAQDGGEIKVPGTNLSYDITVGFLDAALGCTRRIRTTTSKNLDIRVPPGTGDGQTLRLKAQGLPGLGGAEAGDAIVVVTVEKHPVFTRRDDDILSTLGVSLPEAVLGCQVEVPTIHGPVTLEIPPGANTDTLLRLKGKGIERDDQSRGDQIVTLKVFLPKTHNPDLTKFIEHWAKTNAYPIRRYPGDTGD